jgi:hypothetical protein
MRLRHNPVSYHIFHHGFSVLQVAEPVENDSRIFPSVMTGQAVSGHDVPNVFLSNKLRLVKRKKELKISNSSE